MKFQIVCALRALAVGLCASLFVVGASAQKQFSTVVLDPGHGGKDPGAIGKKTQEKKIVLDVALKLGKMLNDSMPAVKTLYTRSKDVFVPLDERAALANKNAADLFISIHANSIKSSAIQGVETFVLGLHRSKENLEVAQKENAVISLEEDYTNKYEGFDPSQPESYIIFELMQNVYLDQSVMMASFIQNSLVGNGREDRGVKQAGFLVLRKTSMPSVLVELGFISNPNEEAYMMSEEGMNKMVESLYYSIKSYKAAYDGVHSVALGAQPQDPEKESKESVNLWPDGVNYRVQVAASKAQLSFDSLNVQAPLSVLVEGDMNKYMFGIFDNLDDAKDLQSQLKASFAGCFVVSFDGKEKISLRAAKKKQK